MSGCFFLKHRVSNTVHGNAGFRLVLKSMTLIGIERCNNPYGSWTSC